MKSRLQLLKEVSSKTGLAPDERASLRDSLLDYIDKNPIQEPLPLTDSFSLPHSNFKRIGTIVIALAVVASGVAYAFPNQSKAVITSVSNKMIATIMPALSLSINGE